MVTFETLRELRLHHSPLLREKLRVYFAMYSKENLGVLEDISKLPIDDQMKIAKQIQEQYGN